jgi:hypothetical protein
MVTDAILQGRKRRHQFTFLALGNVAVPAWGNNLSRVGVLISATAIGTTVEILTQEAGGVTGAIYLLGYNPFFLNIEQHGDLVQQAAQIATTAGNVNVSIMEIFDTTYVYQPPEKQ